MDNLNKAGTESFQLGDWLVKPSGGFISRDGEKQHLEPRMMTVLSLLAANAGEVISREQLESEAWAGMVVGYDALASTILKLRKALGDDSRKPEYIETVSKRGYRLVAPVNFDVEESVAQFPANSQKPVTATKTNNRWRTVALVSIVGAVLVTGGLFTWQSISSHRGNDQLAVAKLKTLAVMPFTNISGNEKDEYFVDGISDDIATELSGLSSILVISRTATSRYKGQAYDPRQTGKDLGATYLVEGSVRKAGKEWRINARLIDTKAGTLLWAKRFEDSNASLFESQDKITSSIVSSLKLSLNSTEEAKLRRHTTNNFEAYDLFLQGQKLFKIRTREANDSAIDTYRKAIDLDPNFARAYGALAVTLAVRFFRGWSDSPDETINRSLAMAKESVRLDPQSPQAYWALGYAQMFLKQQDQAMKSVKHAIEISPNYADGYGLLALINNQLGNGQEAKTLILKAMKLNPHYSWDYPYNLGRADYLLGNYKEAIKYLKLALDRNDQAINPRLYYIASLVALGNKDDAEWEIEKVKIQSPETTLARLNKDYPIFDEQVKKKFFGELRTAGLPE